MPSIDSAHRKQIVKKKISKKVVSKAKPQSKVSSRKITHRATQKSAKKFKTKKTVKYISAIVSTFVLTFLLSLATSQGLADLKSDHTTPLSSIQNISQTSPLAVTDTPQEIRFKDTVQDKPGILYLPIEKIDAPDPLQKRKEFLEAYLKAHNSPLADHVDAISEQSQWKLIIGISRAESSFCKRQMRNNCWGIGGAWNLKNYADYDKAVADVNRILEQHYISAGLNSPSKIVRKWVGHNSDTWEAAVSQELKNLESVE